MSERSRKASFEMKCLRPMVRVTRWDRARYDEIWKMAGIEETLADKGLEECEGPGLLAWLLRLISYD